MANSLINAPHQLLALIHKVQAKALSRLKQAGHQVLGHTNASVRLVRAYAEGRYRDIPLENVVLLIAALAYFLAPVDAVPDMFFALGITDDIALLTWTFNKLKSELDQFVQWEAAQSKNATTGDVIDVTDYRTEN